MKELADRVFSQISKEELVKFTKELISVPTVSEGRFGESLEGPIEAKIAPLIARKMEEIGMNVEIQDVYPGRPNVIGILEGKHEKPTLVFDGHTDTVDVDGKWRHDPFKPIVKDGLLYGRGAADTKGSLAAAIIAAGAIRKAGIELDGNMIVAATADEEPTGKGSLEFVKSNISIDSAVICEPTNLEIHTCHKGAALYDITIKGKAVHGSIPYSGINAIDKMLKVIGELDKYKLRLREKRHPILGSPTFTYTIIDGGSRSFTVPDICRLVVDTRLIPGETPEERLGDIQDVLNKLKKEDRELIIDFKPKMGLDPSETPPEERIVQVALKATETALGHESSIRGMTGCCVMTFYVNLKNIPTIILGAGSIEQAHIVDEYVQIHELVKAAKIYSMIALNYLGGTLKS